jgi:hypothetical protein
MAGTLLLLGMAGLCLYCGFWIRSAVGLVLDLIGIFSFFGAWHFAASSARRVWIDNSPQKGYIDHLQDLEESRAALEGKIAGLESLKDHQPSFASERAGNRLKLLDAALENRKLKLALVHESQFAIQARRQIAKIQALVQSFSQSGYSADLEKELSEALVDLQNQAEQAPREWKSAAGKRIRLALDKLLTLAPALRERIEDCKILAAVDEERESAGSTALAGVLSRVWSPIKQGTIAD